MAGEGQAMLAGARPGGELQGMQQMLDFLDKAGHKEEYVVLIDDLKRLARDLIGHFTLRKAIRSRGAQLESPSHRFSDDPEGVFG